MELLIVGSWIAGFIVCIMKGKYGLAALGFLFPLSWYIGAIRVAKPGSYWAKANYGTDEHKQALAAVRFPEAQWKADWKAGKSEAPDMSDVI